MRVRPWILFAENLDAIGKFAAGAVTAPVENDDYLEMYDAETAAAIRADREAERAATGTCEVLNENWPILELWHVCQGFFRYAPMGGVAGLDYPQIAAFFSLSGDVRPAESWRGVRIIECAFVAALHEK